MTGSLLVLAKAPLHLTDTDIRWLAVGPTFMLCLGGFFFSAVSDHLSRKSIVLIGVFLTTFLTLLIPLVQTAEQLIILRLLTGLGAGGVVSAAFPIAAELMPAQHRRTYSAVYEMGLASSFTVVPFIAGLLAGNANAFRFLALPGGLAVTVDSGHRLSRATRKPALVLAQGAAAGRDRHCQSNHPSRREPGPATDPRGAR